VPNLNVEEYNKRANEILYQRIGIIDELGVPDDQLPAFFDQLKGEITREVYD
jgi:hypothetical protein